MPAGEVAAFRQNLAYARTMAATATALAANLTAAIDVSDLLRAALVQGVSAFDYFVHEEARVRMLAIHLLGPASWPPAFSRFKVAMTSVDLAVATQGTAWLDSEIREQHGHLAFQQPEKVADAMRLVSNANLWDAVAAHVGKTPADVKTELKVIVDRRNKIAHEADFDPTPPASRYSITRALVDQALDFLESVVDAIDAVI